jgi:hypothetical protein
VCTSSEYSINSFCCMSEQDHQILSLLFHPNSNDNRSLTQELLTLILQDSTGDYVRGGCARVLSIDNVSHLIAFLFYFRFCRVGHMMQENALTVK